MQLMHVLDGFSFMCIVNDITFFGVLILYLFVLPGVQPMYVRLHMFCIIRILVSVMYIVVISKEMNF